MDAVTKRRQIVALAIGLVTLAMVAAAAAWSDSWSVIGTIVSCVAFGGWFAYSERRVRFVRYRHKP